MKKALLALSAAIIFLFAGAAFADEYENLDLKFEIMLNGNYREGIKSPATSFAIKTVITNIGYEDQRIVVWSCGYGDAWVADAGIFVTGQMSCPQNVQQDVILKRHQNYTRILQVTVVRGTPLGPLTFKLGYRPPPEPAPWAAKGFIQPPVVWSNALTIKIEKWMLPLFTLEPKE